MKPSPQVPSPAQAPSSGCSCLWQCSSTCGKGLQSRVVQCMHKVTGRHGNECPALSKPAAYRQCHQEVCNDKINVNTITSPRLGECLCWPPASGGCCLPRPASPHWQWESYTPESPLLRPYLRSGEADICQFCRRSEVSEMGFHSLS